MVTSSVEEVNELIGIIAIASREQASGVEGINTALAELQSPACTTRERSRMRPSPRCS